jgi:hypothetical protein
MYSYSVLQGKGGGGGYLGPLTDKHQVPLLVNFLEKPTLRVWCLYRYCVHA